MTQAAPSIDRSAEMAWLRDLGRAFGGALLFGLPLLMTMEMWEAGAAMGPGRQLTFLAFSIPLLWGLSWYAGFSRQRGLIGDGLDVAVALAVGFITAAVLLVLFGVIRWGDPADEVAGRLMLQAAPAAMGALLARRQLAGGDDGVDEGDEDRASYPGELFLMAAGALFLALNMAPTEEMELIAYKASPLHILGLMTLSVALMHGIVYAAGFAGQEEHGRPVAAFFHFTLPGYAIALLVGLFVLWTFGRVGGQGVGELVSVVLVLGFPAAIGAAAARLLV
ncbi:MAG: TIGR02587 family membrane protein [Brevundimonas sp.]